MSLSSRRTLLVVDDEAVLLELLTMEFERKGFRVLTAGSVSEALMVAGKEKVDVVLSDVRMPDGDGVELLRKLRALDPKLIVFLISGYLGISTDEVLKLGAAGVFPKPFNRKELTTAVMAAMARSPEPGESTG